MNRRSDAIPRCGRPRRCCRRHRGSTDVALGDHHHRDVVAAQELTDTDEAGKAAGAELMIAGSNR